MAKKLIIFGLSNIAECAFEYFSYDSDYQVAAFTVDNGFLEEGKKEHMGIPVVAFEHIEQIYAPEEYEMFVALGSHQLNRIRSQKCHLAKQKGYKLASYVSSKAFVWRNVKLGEHVFIQEHNTLQPFTEVGNNVVLWAGNHIGHASKIEDNCFITSQVVISGHCHIGENTFIGVNAAIADNITIGKDNFIGMGVNITRSTADDAFYKPAKSELTKLSAKRFAKVIE